MEYTKKEAAEYLGIGVKMVEKYLASGRLKGVLRTAKHGTQRVFDQAELDAFKAEREATTYLPTPDTPTESALSPPVHRDGMALVPVDRFDAFLSALDAFRAVADAQTLDADRALTLSDAAKESGLSVPMLRREIRAGRLPARTDIRPHRIRRADLAAFMRRFWSSEQPKP